MYTMNNPSSKQLRRTHSTLSTPGSSQNVAFSPACQSHNAWVLATGVGASPTSTKATATAGFANEMNRGRAEIPPNYQLSRGNLNYTQQRAGRTNTSPSSTLSPYHVPSHVRQPGARQRSPAGRRGRTAAWSFGTNPIISLDPSTMDDEPDADAVAQIKSLIPVIPRLMNGEADVGKMVDRLAKGGATPGLATLSGWKTQMVNNSSHSRTVGDEIAMIPPVADADGGQSRDVDDDDGAGADFDILFNAMSHGGYVP